jgi:hypothetical protein
MLYVEIIAAFSQIHKENLVHSEGQNIKFVSVKPGGMNLLHLVKIVHLRVNFELETLVSNARHLKDSREEYWSLKPV